MTGFRSVDDVAAAMREVYASSTDRMAHGDTFSLFADVVEFRHDPPMRGFDGPKRTPELESLGEAEIGALTRALPDLHLENAEVWVEAREVHVRYEQVGTREDGREVRLPLHLAHAVARGEVVSITSIGETQPERIELMLAAGFALPGAAEMGGLDDNARP